MPGPELPCSCGEPAQYRGRHEKTFESVLGPLRLERAYYHCAQCQGGFCPRDRALRLELFSLTPGVLRMTGSAAALVSFQESSSLLHELAGVEVSISQVQRAAEDAGRRIATDERVCVERMGEVAPTMYLGMDGTGVPMRPAEVAGRVGKQPDGSAKTREAKVVTVWTAESRDEAGTPVRDPGIDHLFGRHRKRRRVRHQPPTDPTSPSVCCAKLRGEGSPRRPDARCWGMVQAWIWNTATELFPQAIQILDRYHAKEALHRAAQSIFGATSANAKPWATARCTELDDGKLQAIIQRAPTPCRRPATKRQNVPRTSIRNRAACAIRSSTRRVCAPPPASWRPDAKWRSAPGSNAPACTGRVCWRQRHHRPALLPSSVDASRISGSAVHSNWRLPHDSTS